MHRLGAPEPGRDLVLVGGGHAHVQVIRRWMMAPLPDVRLTVVLDGPEAAYSGMLPGFVAGEYTADDFTIDLVPLARRAGARVVLAAATRVEAVSRRIDLQGRPSIRYDVASLNVGSTVRGREIPGAFDHALTTRPIPRFVAELDARLAELPDVPRVAVVGTGAAGVELAFTLDARLRAAGIQPQLTLLGEASTLLPGAARRAVHAAERLAQARGFRVLTGARVMRVAADAVVLEGVAQPLPVDLVVWAAGAAAPPLLEASDLPTDAAGFVRVRDTLEVEGCEALFAAGDCAALVAHPWLPKAGVYAVRQGPLLDANLRAALGGRPLRRYRPQRSFLALLNLGERRALGTKWGVVKTGRAVWRLKDWIDRRFMRRFQVLAGDGAPAASFPSAESMGMEPMECGGCAAKLAVSPLEAALARLDPAPDDPSVRLGLARPDDVAAVELPGGDVLLATIDGFPAFCDDPWLVGRVAAVNAVSDVLAKGGRPRHALALVTVPDVEPARGEDTLHQVLSGVRAALDPLGVTLLGGHTTRGPELFVGLSITGELSAGAEPLPLDGARAGDCLLLTQALGSGVLLAADMQGLARGVWVEALHAVLVRDNAAAAEIARRHAVHASTDVSGFGLAGHLCEMLAASGVAAELCIGALPAFAGVRELLARGVRSTFHAQNAELRRRIAVAATADPLGCALLFDPQTSGGLLLAVASERADAVLADLRAAGDGTAARIGVVTPPRGDGKSFAAT
ncbi:MAG: selenide, water dikinase SelD [Deltaproteobacteria bacterium]|nr:selenide, water dikinase SelD [Deltaproteobacteria bacterium]MBW2361291.1 selenide, water dikinase SelD [Deltaproteobacteria bacterium]